MYSNLLLWFTILKECIQNIARDHVILVKRSTCKYDIQFQPKIVCDNCLHTLTQMINQSNPNLENSATFLFTPVQERRDFWIAGYN